MVCSTRVLRAVLNGPIFFSKVQNIRAKKIEPKLVHFKGCDAGFQKGSPGQSKDTKKPSTNKIIVVHTTAKTIQKQRSF